MFMPLKVLLAGLKPESRIALKSDRPRIRAGATLHNKEEEYMLVRMRFDLVVQLKLRWIVALLYWLS